MVNTFVIEWTGPYTDPKDVEDSNILYLITGNKPQGPEAEKIRYIGITSNTLAMRFDRNHLFWTLAEKNRKIWLGKIKNCSIQRYSDAEWLLIHYLQNYQSYNRNVDLENERKTTKPENSICVVNRWFNPRKEEYANYVFPFKHIPDVIYWNSGDNTLLTSDRIYIENEG